MKIKKELLDQGFISCGDVVLDLRSLTWRIVQGKDFLPRLAPCQIIAQNCTGDELQKVAGKFIKEEAYNIIQHLVVDALTHVFIELKDPKYKPIVDGLLEGDLDVER